MISIITAIYNQLPVNKIFWEYLNKNTSQPFELIIIDNGSNDGSSEFFKSVGAIVINNSANYSYPYSQNQGIKTSRYDWLAFLNNDIVVSKNWDTQLIQSMTSHGLDVATVCGIEQLENLAVTKQIKRRWKRVKGLLSLFGYGDKALRAMHRWMYGDWEQFCRERNERFAGVVKEGFVGNTVMMRRQALDKIGLWDERIQAADFDLYLRTKTRSEQVGDIKPVHICMDVFNHHYIRLTAKTKYPPFADRDNLIQLADKWSDEDLQVLTKLHQP
jgi:GT2 family glycosyltransferase